MSQYDQAPTEDGKLLTEDNEILDLQEFMESGVIKATAVSSASPVTPIGEATIPNYEQITPQAKKFINSENEIYDLLVFLQSGNLKLQVSGAAFDDATYVTSTNETARLPNSVQLLGTANQVTVTDGVLSLAEDLILPGTINLNGFDILSNEGQNIRLAPGNPNLDWIDLQSKTVNILESLIFNNSPTNNIFYNSVDHEFYFNANNQRVLSLSVTGVSVGADLLLGTHKITSASGTPLQLIPDNDSDGIDLASSIVRIDADLQHAGEPNNKIAFTTAAQTHYIGGSSIYDINASGFRLGMGYRVNLISNDAANVLDTTILTAYATQTAIANALIGANPFQGFWDASGGTFPTLESGGDPIVAGDWWRISVAGTLGGVPVSVGNQIFAVIDNPGQTAGNWSVINPRVYSVFNRTGSVVATFGDYSFDLISGTAVATQGGTGLASYTKGDTIYASNTNVLSKLSIGSTNQVYTVASGGVPAWQDLDVDLSSSGNFMTSTVNGAGSITTIVQSANLSSSTNFMNVFVNGVFGSAVSIVNSISLSSSTNSMTSTVNGVSSSSVNIVNSISLGLSGNALTATVNGQTSAAVNVQPANTPVTASSSTQSLASNTAYYVTYAGLCTMPLPATASVGDIIKIRAVGASSTFKITQASGQSINYGAQNGVAVATTTGTSGYLQSSEPNTTVTLECTVANTTFIVVDSVNNLTVN